MKPSATAIAAGLRPDHLPACGTGRLWSELTGVRHDYRLIGGSGFLDLRLLDFELFGRGFRGDEFLGRGLISANDRLFVGGEHRLFGHDVRLLFTRSDRRLRFCRLFTGNDGDLGLLYRHRRWDDGAILRHIKLRRLHDRHLLLDERRRWIGVQAGHEALSELAAGGESIIGHAAESLHDGLTHADRQVRSHLFQRNRVPRDLLYQPGAMAVSQGSCGRSPDSAWYTTTARAYWS